MTGVYVLTVWPSEETPADHFVLGTVRRALLGMQEHGFISDLNTYSGEQETTWSWRNGGGLQHGSEDGREVLTGMVEVLRSIAPVTWLIETKLEEGP